MLTIEEFRAIPDGEVFKTGITTDNSEGINMTNSGRQLRWVAKKGHGDDWAIYIHWGFNSEEYIKQSGDKVSDNDNIVKLVPCSEEVLNKYIR